MSERIGQLWELGESQFRSGNALEALLNFQRAKSLLITESSSVYSNPAQGNGKASKILGEIMTKLTGSIDRASDILTKNPVLALGLSTGFTKTVRCLILLFQLHPSMFITLSIYIYFNLLNQYCAGRQKSVSQVRTQVSP